MTRLLLEFMRRKRLALNDVALLPPGGGFLLVEMGAWDAAEAQAKAEALARAAQSWPHIRRLRAFALADEAARVWHVRESALGATVFVPGEPDRWEGWEDAAVPPAQLGAYLRELFALMASTAIAARSMATMARAACTCASISISAPRKGCAISASSSIARPIWCSALADRSAASTATARRAPRCCRRCSDRS